MATVTSWSVVLIAMAAAIVFALALAYVPMRLLLGQMSRHVRNFIERQRDRRRVARETPERRHVT